MSHIKNTSGHVVDYSLLAGKSKPLNLKQNGIQKENANADMPVEVKYASPSSRKINLRGEVTSQKDEALQNGPFS